MDWIKFHKSRSREITSLQDRVRDLIGPANWGDEGRYKESVLRQVLRQTLAADLDVGTGFAIGRSGTTTQIDILVSQVDKARLFTEGDFRILTSDSVLAMIEVKTKLKSCTELTTALKKLSKNCALVDRDRDRAFCGLFCYEPMPDDHRRILRCLQDVHGGRAQENVHPINWIALGPDRFVRFWENDPIPTNPRQSEDYCSYHMYDIEGLAFSYFVSNVARDTCTDDPSVPEAWFPIPTGKEVHRSGVYDVATNEITT